MYLKTLYSPNRISAPLILPSSVSHQGYAETNSTSHLTLSYRAININYQTKAFRIIPTEFY